MNAKSIIRFGLLSILFVVPYLFLFSLQDDRNINSLSGGTDTLIVEDGIIHLGNDEGNQGITFSKVFTLSDSQYSHLKCARLYIDFIPDYGPFYENPPKLFINDVYYGSITPFFPPIGVGCWRYWEDGTHDYCGFMQVDLEISRTDLISGDNTFRIDNGQYDDDYQFTNVRVVIFYCAILNPDEDNIWIAGEQDTIRWEGVDEGASIIIEYSADSGTSWQMIASGISGDTGKYAWDIPSGILSTKCFVRIKDYTSGDTLAVSDKFKIKPYTLTKIDPVTGDFIAYDITKNRWGFGNYQDEMWSADWYSQFDYNGLDPFTSLPYPTDVPFIGAKSRDYVDWPSFVRAFGKNACYWNTLNATYNQRALTLWESQKSKWGGSCFAIAGSNALAFENKEGLRNKFPDFPDFITPINVTSDHDVIKSMAELFEQQYGNPTKNHVINNWLSKTPNQTLEELKTMLKTEATKTQTLALFKNNGSGGHTILPYKLERSSYISTNWLIWVWDNSYTNDETAFVYLDSAANDGKGIWTYTHLPGWGGPGCMILNLESSTYLGTPTLPKRNSYYSPFVLNDTVLQVTTSYDNDIQIRDNQGHVTGYADSLLSYDIPGSVPMILPTGKVTPPYGYHLKKDDYSIILDNFTEDTIGTYFFTGNEAFSYIRYGVINTQTDRLSFSVGISAANPDADMKNVRLMSLSSDTTDEKIAVLESLGLSQYDSVRLEKLDNYRYRLKSFGGQKSYLLDLKHVSVSGLLRFRKSDIELAANTTHTIEPNWTDLDSSILIVLVDEENNGTIDDTLRLQNDLTGIHDHGSFIPGEYKLYQNYPNPFNPVTTINYDIPKASYVTLKVYSLLGQEVATLVNERRESGTYSTQLDGSKLPSGMYFYSLQAGQYTNTKKFILLK